MDIYLSMGFPEELAAAAPSDPEVGVHWLIVRTTMGTLPKRLCREGPLTFYNSVLRINGFEYKIIAYEPEHCLACVRDAESLVTNWISVADPQIEWVTIRHDDPPALQPLVAYPAVQLAPMRLDARHIPTQMQEQLAQGPLDNPQLLGYDWALPVSMTDTPIWMSILSLSNKRNLNLRFEPDFERPRTITATGVERRRDEIRSKIALFCMLCNNRIDVATVVGASRPTFLAAVADLPHASELRDLRLQFLQTRRIMGDEMKAWNDACAAMVHVDRIELDDERHVIVHAHLTNWVFKPYQRPGQSHHASNFLTPLLNRNQEYTTPPSQAPPMPPDALLPEQVALWNFMHRCETRRAPLGWKTRTAPGGLVWSHSQWGNVMKGVKSNLQAAVLRSPSGTGKKVVVALTCRHRNMSTVVLTRRRDRFDAWTATFERWAAGLRVQTIGSTTGIVDETADVHITTMELYKKRFFRVYWDRVIVADADMLKRRKSRIYKTLCSVQPRMLWLISNKGLTTQPFRQMLRIRGYDYDDDVWSPTINIDRHLTFVTEHVHHWEPVEPHARLIQAFNAVWNGCDDKHARKHRASLMYDVRSIPITMFGESVASICCIPTTPEVIQTMPICDRLTQPCPICYEDMVRPCVTECHHVFCHECMRRSRNQSLNCPMCRHESTTYHYTPNVPINELMADHRLESWIHITPEVRSDYDSMGTAMYGERLIALAKSLDGNTLILDNQLAHEQSMSIATFLNLSHIDKDMCNIVCICNKHTADITRKMKTLTEANRNLHIVQF